MDTSKYDENGNLRQGPYVWYFKDGTTVATQGQHDRGQKMGIWTYFYNNGGIQGVGPYEDDVISGEWKWFRKTGELMQTGSFRDGKKTGLWTRYYPSGGLMDEGRYEADQRVGTWNYYDRSGNLSRSQDHKPPRQAVRG